MSVPDAKQLNELGTENVGLKKLLAEQLLENETIKDALRKSSDRTGSARLGAALHGWGYSERRSVAVVRRVPVPRAIRRIRTLYPITTEDGDFVSATRTFAIRGILPVANSRKNLLVDTLYSATDSS